MRRFLLHLKLEAWRVWPWIALWVGLLGLRGIRFVVAWNEAAPERYFAPQDGWYLDLLLLLMGVLPFIVMKLDDAGDPNAFWTTRPRTLGELLLVKLALLGVIVVGGWVGLSALRLGIVGWPMGCWKELVFEAGRASMVVLVASAIAWGRPGWRQPLVVGALAIGLWHLVGLHPGEGHYDLRHEVLYIVAYLAVALFALTWVLRKRRTVPIVSAVAVGVVSVILSSVWFSLARENEPSRFLAEQAEQIPNTYTELAASLVDRGEIPPHLEDERSPGRNLLRVPNPFPGEPVSIGIADADKDGRSLMQFVAPGSGFSRAADGHRSIDFEFQPWAAWSIRRVLTGHLQLAIYKLGDDAVVLPLGGGRFDLPGSQTEFGTRQGFGDHNAMVGIEVSARTILFDQNDAPAVRYAKEWSPLRSFPSFRFGYDLEETLSRVVVPGRDLLELRHPGTGEVFRLDQLRAAVPAPGRARGVWHFEWHAFGVKQGAPDVARFDDAWLEAAELVIQKQTLVGLHWFPFEKTILPLATREKPLIEPKEKKR